METKKAIKKELKIPEKTLYLSNYTFKDICSDVKKWKSWDSFPKEERNMSHDVNGKAYKYVEDIPLNLRRIYGSIRTENDGYISFEAVLNQDNWAELKNIFVYIDDRDSLSLELIEWDEGYLVVKSNSLIISSWWLSIVSKEEVNEIIKKLEVV